MGPPRAIPCRKAKTPKLTLSLLDPGKDCASGGSMYIRMLDPKAEVVVTPIIASALTEAFTSIGGAKCSAFNAATFGE